VVPTDPVPDPVPDPDPKHWFQQGVTKRCRLSLLTNCAPRIRVPMRGEGGFAGSQPMSTAVHISRDNGVQINFGDLPPYLTFGFQSSDIVQYLSVFFRCLVSLLQYVSVTF
jgi:hypothetical protein